jgi:hypothetical protein
MKETSKQICLILSIASFSIFIGIWILAIWYDLDDTSFLLKLSATSIVIFIASTCGYIFIHESDDELRDRNLSN